MELSGDEKRIRALFSELSGEHRSDAPRFEKLWMRAEANAREPVVAIRRSAVMVAAVMVLVAACLLAASTLYRSSQSQHALNIPPQTIPATSRPSLNEPAKLVAVKSKMLRVDHQRRAMRQGKTVRMPIHETEMLSKWQSPTNIFLQSPAAAALSSLPQLNQSARDLEMFLPKNNEVMKESKQ
jgi:hypothetical protein